MSVKIEHINSVILVLSTILMTFPTRYVPVLLPFGFTKGGEPQYLDPTIALGPARCSEQGCACVEFSLETMEKNLNKRGGSIVDIYEFFKLFAHKARAWLKERVGSEVALEVQLDVDKTWVELTLAGATTSVIASSMAFQADSETTQLCVINARGLARVNALSESLHSTDVIADAVKSVLADKAAAESAQAAAGSAQVNKVAALMRLDGKKQAQCETCRSPGAPMSRCSCGDFRY